mgnify:CR=1 FL=1
MENGNWPPRNHADNLYTFKPFTRPIEQEYLQIHTQLLHLSVMVKVI